MALERARARVTEARHAAEIAAAGEREQLAARADDRLAYEARAWDARQTHDEILRRALLKVKALQAQVVQATEDARAAHASYTEADRHGESMREELRHLKTTVRDRESEISTLREALRITEDARAGMSVEVDSLRVEVAFVKAEHRRATEEVARALRRVENVENAAQQAAAKHEEQLLTLGDQVRAKEGEITRLTAEVKEAERQAEGGKEVLQRAFAQLRTARDDVARVGAEKESVEEERDMNREQATLAATVAAERVAMLEEEVAEARQEAAKVGQALEKAEARLHLP